MADESFYHFNIVIALLNRGAIDCLWPSPPAAEPKSLRESAWVCGEY